MTREVTPADDALDGFDPDGFAWLHHGTRLVTSGVAARVAPADAAALLAAIDADDPIGLPGTGAVAVGALPFDPDAAGELVVPARVYGSTTAARGSPRSGPASRQPSVAVAPPTRFQVVAPRIARDEWRRRGRARARRHRAGELEKVVLAREVLIEADAPFDAHEIVRGLVASQPGSFVYASRGLRRGEPRAPGAARRRRRRVAARRRHRPSPTATPRCSRWRRR